MLNATRLLLVAPGSSAVLQMSFVCSAPSQSRANGNHLSAAPTVSRLEFSTLVSSVSSFQMRTSRGDAVSTSWPGERPDAWLISFEV